MAETTEDKVRARIEEQEIERQAQANRGVAPSPPAAATDRNPSGTFSEPTPTDVRYPNKLETEFENNLGAHVGKSAAQMREQLKLPDEPGGLKPESAPDHVKAAVEAGRMPAPADEPPAEGDADARRTPTAEVKAPAAKAPSKAAR